ncbi:hypothetical protein MAM1_0168d07104 [Mucor ambiguus]|uniref:Uncharacterized protein n=1 Tax=Mucor ambiguus TaxID=91626 RepID=A0A0C9MJL4_9FUNG|nr:hypothetical protein MAM1_0168d07104 [Mucor ambiguus]
MLYFKTVAFMFLVTIYTTLIQDVFCKTVMANGSQRLALSNKRRINYSKRGAATAPAALPALPNIQIPNADATSLLASAGPLLASISSVKIPQLPALPGAAAAAAAAPAAPAAPAAGYPAPAGSPPQYQAAPAPKAAKKDEDEEEKEEDEEDEEEA